MKQQNYNRFEVLAELGVDDFAAMPRLPLFSLYQDQGKYAYIHDTAVGLILSPKRGLLDEERLPDDIKVMVDKLDKRSPLTEEEFTVYNDSQVAFMISCVLQDYERKECIKAQGKSLWSIHRVVVDPEKVIEFDEQKGKSSRMICIRCHSVTVAERARWSYLTLFSGIGARYDVACSRGNLYYIADTYEMHDRMLEVVRKASREIIYRAAGERYKIVSYKLRETIKTFGELAISVPAVEGAESLAEKYPGTFTLDANDKSRVLVSSTLDVGGRISIGGFMLDQGVFSRERLEQRKLLASFKDYRASSVRLRDFRVFMVLSKYAKLAYEDSWAVIFGDSVVFDVLDRLCKL